MNYEHSKAIETFRDLHEHWYHRNIRRDRSWPEYGNPSIPEDTETILRRHKEWFCFSDGVNYMDAGG